MKKLAWMLLLAAIMGTGGVLAQDGSPPPPEFPGEALPADQGDLFSGAGACTGCHTNMIDEAGTDVSIGAYWRSTMMANASRDPYWLASMRVETELAPDYKAIVEDKCATCHMPMARTTLTAQEETSPVLDGGLVAPDHDLHTLAMDGVSCTLCHQIEATGLGEMESFSGGYVIDTELPMGERLSYSPFAVTDDLAAQMQNASGFVPTESPHIAESILCASCHTLYTPYLDASGEIAGEFPEQMPYFEWLHSDYVDALSCQGCHMPDAVGGVVTSVTGGPPRSPFAMHNFVGGNVYLQQIFRTFGEDMAVTAGSAHFDATYERTLNRLQNLTATVTLEDFGCAESRLAGSVVIETHTGHKFPTGFPSRRAWLHIQVVDADGQVVFESGAVNADGSIAGDDHDADPAQYEPHRKVIYEPDQVQIYESVMVDTEDHVTNILLRGSGYVKDNRLLPAGFDKTAADDKIAVDANAQEDANFVGGGDRVMVSVDVDDAPGPFTVTVELLYQSLGFHWAEKLRAHDAPESTRFLTYYDAVPNHPVVVASATATVSEE